jgi:hypothetical protein
LGEAVLDGGVSREVLSRDEVSRAVFGARDARVLELPVVRPAAAIFFTLAWPTPFTLDCRSSRLLKGPLDRSSTMR